jgi:peroxiredoxin
MSRKQITTLSALVMLVTSLSLFASRLNAGRQRESGGRGKAPAGLISTPRQKLPAHRMVYVDQQDVPADELSHGRVLLVYMTTSCGPCIEEAGIISRLYKAAPPDLRIYGVSFERPAQVATFVKELDLKFPMLIDVGSQLARSLDVHYFPSTFLVEDGVITKAWRGVTRDEADLEQQLNTR